MYLSQMLDNYQTALPKSIPERATASFIASAAVSAVYQRRVTDVVASGAIGASTTVVDALARPLINIAIPGGWGDACSSILSMYLVSAVAKSMGVNYRPFEAISSNIALGALSVHRTANTASIYVA